MALPRLDEIGDPKRCPLPEAIEAARRMATADPAFDAGLAQSLSLEWAAHKADLAVIERLLALLSEIAPPERLASVLRAALRHTDARVRSKAALVLGQRVESSEVLLQLATDDDSRVRANTVEALWGRQTDSVKALYERALDDLHHRVAANAAFGLFQVDPDGHAVRLARFVHHPHPRFRRAGAWILRKIGDPRNLKDLQPLVTDKNAEVRSAAFRALVALRQIASQQGIPIDEAAGPG